MTDPREPNVFHVAWRGDHQGRAPSWWLEQLRQPRLAKRLMQRLDVTDWFRPPVATASACGISR